MGYKAINMGTTPPRSCRDWVAQSPGPGGIYEADTEMLAAG